MKMFGQTAIGALFALATLGATASSASAVEIEYWQYNFQVRVDAIDELINRFEARNPDITVKQVTFPFAQFRTKVGVAIPAGEGPDVVQLFYGWLDSYRAANLLQPLSADVFDPAEIDADFFPFVQAMKVDGVYWGLPTAVRSLALFWNKDLFAQAGLDPEKPPQTWDEFITIARQLTQRDAAGNILVEGATVEPTAQDHHWWREVLLRQFGGQAYSDDGTTVLYNSEAGIKATELYANLITKDRIGEIGFFTNQPTAFKSGHAALTFDGSFRLGTFNGQEGLNYGITELPVLNGVQSNFSSFWANGLTPNATGEKKVAAEKFLKFLTTPEAMEVWLATAGELPARPELALQEQNTSDPQFGPFIRGLSYAHSTKFVDELAQRQAFVDMIDRITIEGMSVPDSVAIAAAEEQAILDRANQ